MNIKKLTTLASLLALNIVISMFYIPVGENLRIYFTFLINMYIASKYSFVEVFIYAIVEDLLSFFIFPTGSFFIGYTLTSVVSLCIYYFFLHKKVNLLTVSLAKISVNVLANILLNSFWSYLLFSKGYLYYLSKSIIKNIVLIPFEVILFMLFYKLIKNLDK